MKSLNLLAGLLTLWAIGLAGCDNKAADEVKSQVEQALDSIKDFKLGDVDLKEKFNSIVMGIRQQVAEIHDGSSAEAALPALKEALGNLKDLKTLFGKLPANARAAFGKLMAGELIIMEGELEVAQESMEGVKSVVGDTFNSIIKTLKEFK